MTRKIGGECVVLNIAGVSRSGKTTLMTKLIRKLSSKGYVVATIKNCDKALTLDTKGKDTWEHKRAGAALAVLNTSIESTVLFKHPQELDELINLIGSAVRPDIILVEGHKRSDLPKIWVKGREGGRGRDGIKNVVMDYSGDFDKVLDFVIEEIEVNNLTAKLAGLDCGRCGFGSCRELAVQIHRHKKSVRDCPERLDGLALTVTSAGEHVQLNRFAASAFAGVITGFAGELKGVRNPNELEITLRRKRGK